MKSFYLSKEDLVDSEETDSFYQNILEYEKMLVDIHCSLVKKVADLHELYDIQEQLDKLTEEFYVFNFQFETKFSNTITKNKRFGKFLKYCIPLYLFNIVIPEIGIMLALFLETYNYINIKANKEALLMLEASYTDLQRKCNIIKENIAIKYKLLNERIREYSNGSKNKDLSIEEDLIYYYALQVISNYLNGFITNFDEVEENTMYAIKDILQEYLKSDNEDLNILLGEVKSEEKSLKLIRKKTRIG